MLWPVASSLRPAGFTPRDLSMTMMIVMTMMMMVMTKMMMMMMMLIMEVAGWATLSKDDN